MGKPSSSYVVQGSFGSHKHQGRQPHPGEVVNVGVGLLLFYDVAGEDLYPLQPLLAHEGLDQICHGFVVGRRAHRLVNEDENNQHKSRFVKAANQVKPGRVKYAPGFVDRQSRRAT